MSKSIQVIPLFNLALAFIPVCIVIVIIYFWSKEHRNDIYGIWSSRDIFRLFSESG